MSTVFSPGIGDVVEVHLPASREWRRGTVVSLPSTGTPRYVVILDGGGVELATYFELRPTSPDSIPVAIERHAEKMGAFPVHGTQRADACRELLSRLVKRYDPDTPGRMSRALEDMTSGYGVDIKALLKTFEAPAEQGLVAVRDVPFASLCEHHVLPFTGTASVVYIPNGRIVGLSKIPRLIKAFSRRLQVQERLGQEIAEALWNNLGPRGVMVVMRGRHSCMAIRGIESPGEMVTSYVLGAFRDDQSARAEALNLIR